MAGDVRPVEKIVGQTTFIVLSIQGRMGLDMVSDKIMYEAACDAKTLSNCEKRKVGCAIYADGMIITGYNHYIGTWHNCYRKGLRSGQHLDRCPAIHGEAFLIALLANRGLSCEGATLYTSDIIPCKDCSNLIVVAGITRIVCRELTFYDELSKDILYTAGIKIEDIEGGYL
jgi:dCMP deaminase